MSELVEQVARAIAPVVLTYIEDYDEVPPDHIWTRPRYQWLSFAMTKIATAALSVIESREGWQPIETAPKDGTCAVLYFPQHADDGFDGLDYRYQLAIYRKGEWRDQGTNHDSFEGADLGGDDRATHWMRLPAAIRSGDAG